MNPYIAVASIIVVHLSCTAILVWALWSEKTMHQTALNRIMHLTGTLESFRMNNSGPEPGRYLWMSEDSDEPRLIDIDATGRATAVEDVEGTMVDAARG
jgi:hypothetical protein